jgi:hypothetical protein
MLPLTSQRNLQRWDAVVIEPYAELQLNYIELPTDKYPKLDDICREVSSRSVDRKLVGGLLNVEDIYFKTTLFPNFVACLKDAQKSAFNIDSDVRIVRFTREYTSKAIVHDDPSLPYFGNDFYTKFKTNLASIPVWGVDDDLVETFSTGYRMMEKPLHISREKKLTPRTSILGRKGKLEKILTNDLKVGHGRAESIKNADFAPESKTEDEQKQRSRWGVFPFNSRCDASDRNGRRQNLGDDDTTNFYDGHFERIPELLLPVCTPEKNLLGHIWPDQGSKPEEFLQYSLSTALEPLSGNLKLNALSERGCSSIESNPSTTTTHIIDRLFEKKLSFGTNFESFITVEMEGLIDHKMTSVFDFDASRKKRRIDKDAMQFNKSRLATLKAEDIEEIRGVTAAANPWLQAVQAIDKEVKKRAQFEEFDVLDLEILSSSRSKWSYSGGQNIPMLFSETFFEPRTESSEQRTGEAEGMSMVAIVDIDVTSQFNTRPLSVTGKLVNLVRQILQEPSVRLKGCVKDRLLSSAHALRCIPILPVLPHTFVRGRGSSELGGDESVLHQEVEQWECDPSAVGRSMIAMLHIRFKLDARERKSGGTDQRERQIFSGRSPDVVWRGPQGRLGRVSLLGTTSRSILKEVAEICTPLADSSATDRGLGACSGSRRRKEARRPARPTSMTEFLRYAFLPAASIETTGYSSFCTSDATVTMGAVDIARGAGEECKNQESLATGAALITNIEAVRACKYGDENRYAQLKSPVLSVVPAIIESPHEAKEAGDTENRAVDKMRDDHDRVDEVVTEEPELHSHVPLSHMDIQSGPDPQSSAEIDHNREVASLVPQTLDLDQMVASYLSMHRLPSAGGKTIPPSVERLRVNPIVATPSLISGIPSSHGRRDSGMSLESWSSRFQTGQEAQELEKRKRVMDAVHSSLVVTTRDAPPSIGARNKDKMTRAAPLGKQLQFSTAIYPPTALTSMVTPSKGEGEGEEEVQESNGTERERNVTAPASSFRFNGLCILVSESFLELSEGSWAITTLAEKYGITCIDTLLNDPVTAIVDGSTAICVVEEGIVGQVSLLKEFVKLMTTLVYKYSCIWIIIISRNGDEDAARRDGREGELETGMRNLYTAISRFPITVVVRSIMERDSEAPHATSNTSTDTWTGSVVGAQLAGMIHLICNDIANAVCIAHNILRERFVSRDFLKALLGRDSIAFAEQCDFLQLFPSLNFYTAAQILSNVSLKRIAEHLPERISALKQALQFVPPIDAACLESAFALFTVHCGLQRSVGRSAESVSAIENHREGSPRDREPAADGASVSALDPRELTRAQTVLYSDSLKDHDGGSWVTPENGSQDRRGGDNYVSGGYSRERTAGDRGIRGQRRGQAETQRQGGYGAFHHGPAYGDGIGDNNGNNDDNKNNYACRYGSHENSNIEPRQYIRLHDGSGDRDQNGCNSGSWRSSGGHYDERPTDRGAGRKTGYGYETWDRDGEGFIKQFRPEENEQQFELPYGRRELQRQTAPWNENQYRRTHNDFDERQIDSGSSRQKGDSLAGIVDYDYPKRTKAGAERPRDTQNISGQQQQFQHQRHYQNQKSEEKLHSDIRLADDYDRQIVYSQHQQQYRQQFQQENRQYPLQHSASAVAGRIQDPRSFARPDRR